MAWAPGAGRYAGGRHYCGIDPPLVVRASLLAADRLYLVTGNEGLEANGISADRDQYFSSRAYSRLCLSTDCDATPTLRPILDHLAGLGRKSATPAHDAVGNYVPRIL